MTTYQTIQVPATSQNFGTSLDLDLLSGGSKGAQILSISCSFLGKFGKIVCWHPALGSWRPLLEEILDPPLTTENITYHKVRMQAVKIPLQSKNVTTRNSRKKLQMTQWKNTVQLCQKDT